MHLNIFSRKPKYVMSMYVRKLTYITSVKIYVLELFAATGTFDLI